MSPEELAKKKEKDRILTQRYRIRHPEKAKKTPEQNIARREKSREYQRQYRIDHKDEIAERKANRSQEEIQAERDKKAAAQRRRREDQFWKNPKPVHVVPEENIAKNHRRKELRAKNPIHSRQSCLQQRVQRAEKVFLKLRGENALKERIDEAEAKYANALLDRESFVLASGGKTKGPWLIEKYTQLAAEYKAKHG